MERDVSRKRLARETGEHSGTRNLRKRKSTLLPDFFYPTSISKAKRKKNYQCSKRKVQKLFKIKNKDQDKRDLLSELLNKYSADGIPPLPPSQSSHGPVAFNPNRFCIETNWQELVNNAISLEVKFQMQQERMWELIETEVGYNKSLHVITDLFMNSLLSLQGEQLLTEINVNRLFSNIRDVATGSCRFLQNSLYRVLQNSRETGLPLNPSDMKEGFMQMAEFLTPYTRYCAEQMAAYDYSKACCQGNEQFKAFVLWAEKQKACDRLKLADLLVKPMQRLTRYSLLLHAILKVTEDESQRDDLKTMISSVDNFVCDVNSSLRQRQEQEQVEAVMEKIECFAAVSAPNEECRKYLQESSAGFDLRNPIPGSSDVRRRLLSQPVLQMKDANTKMEVECFLFTDLLLLCKQSKRTGSYKIVKPPMRVDHITVHKLQENVSFLVIYKNEYKVPVLAFTLNGDEAHELHTKIQEAQKLYSKAQSSSSSEYIDEEIMDVITFDHDTVSEQLSGTRTEKVSDHKLPSEFVTMIQNLPSKSQRSSTVKAVESVLDITIDGPKQEDERAQ